MSYYSLNWFSSAFGPSAVLADKEVLFWKASTGKISGSPDLLFDSTAKTLTLGSGGSLRLPDGALGTPSLSFSSTTNTGMYLINAFGQAWVQNGVAKYYFEDGNLRLSIAKGVAWSSTASATGNADVALTRAGIGQLSLSTGNQFLLPDGSASVPSLSFSNLTSLGIYTDAVASFYFTSAAAVPSLRITSPNIVIRSSGSYGFSSSDNASGAADVALTRPGAGQLSLSTGSQFLLPDGSAAAPSLAFNTATQTGPYKTSFARIGISHANNDCLSIASDGLYLKTALPLGWTSGNSGNTALDTILLRDGAAGVLAQRNGVNAQTLRVYGTFTDATLFRCVTLRHTGVEAQIITEKGTLDANTSLRLAPNSGSTFVTGAFLPSTDAGATQALGSSSFKFATFWVGGIAGTCPINVRANAAQTANLQEWQNSSGDVLAQVSKDGYVGIGVAPGTYALSVGYGGTAQYAFINGGLRLGPQLISWGSAVTSDDITLSRLTTGTLKMTSTGASALYIVKAGSAQVLNLQEWQNSSGTPLAYVEKGGALKALGFIEATTAKTGTYTATVNDHLITCDATGGAFSVNLPAVATSAGLILHIKKIDSTTNKVTLDASGSELIDDSLTFDLLAQGENLMIQCDGTAWRVL